MKKITVYILTAWMGLGLLSSCSKQNQLFHSLTGEWLMELKGTAFETMVANSDLDIPEEANGLAIIYHFNDSGLGWKEMDIMEDSHIVFVPYDRYHTTFKYTVSNDGTVDIVFLNEDGKEGEESDDLLLMGDFLTSTYYDQALVFTRASKEKIDMYQAEADAWYGGADTPGNGITGVGEGWNWLSQIPTTANDR